MAIKKIFPKKDTTIYSFSPSINTGLDEILETNIYNSIIGSDIPHTTRILLDFDNNDIKNILSGSNEYEVNLRLSSAIVNGLNLDTILETYPISGSWNMGTGKYEYSPIITNGSSWYWRTYEGGQPWILSQSSFYTTSSYHELNPGGGVWYNKYLTNPSQSIECFQKFEYQGTQNYNIGEDLIDLKINVTDIVEEWLDESGFENNGLIIKHKEEFNPNPAYVSEFKFFSIDTNTIYPPYLEVKYNDYNYITGSNIQIINNENVYVNINMNPGFFHPDEKNIFRVNVRPKHPIRVFQTSSLYTQNFYLPQDSCYAIKDLDTNEYVIDFDPIFTKISADNSGSYFKLDMDGLQWERYYKILIKTNINGNILVFDDKFYFKIIKN